MKKYLLQSLFFFILISGSKAYIPFPTQLAQWNCSYWEGWYNSPSDMGTESDKFSYVTDGDTIFNSVTYTKILLSDWHDTYWILPVSGVYQNSYFTGPSYIGCYRNDSLNQRVLFLPRDSMNEKLLYDFSLNVGDTLRDWWHVIQGLYTSVNVVDSIDSVLIDGLYRKRLFLNADHGYMTYPVIECEFAVRTLNQLYTKR